MAQKFDVFDGNGKAVLTGVAAPITLTDLLPNTIYSGYSVAPTGTLDKHPVDDIVTADEAPSAPTLTVTAGNGEVSYNIVPGADAGSAVTGYRIYYAGPSDADMIAVDLGTALTGTVTDLVNGTEYTFEAVTVNNLGESDRSIDIKATPVDPNAPATSDSSGTEEG